MTTDLTFITNEKGQTLKNRFEALIYDTRFFDCLVGYFYTSGFFNIYKPLENTERIRVLIGIATDRRTFHLLTKADELPQQELQFSHAEVKQQLEGEIEEEFEGSDDNYHVEEWTDSGYGISSNKELILQTEYMQSSTS